MSLRLIRPAVVWAGAIVLLAAFALPSQADQSGDELRRTPVVQAVERVGPAVVNISTEETVRSGGPYFRFQDPVFDELFKDFFERFPQRNYKRQSLGSGVIINPEGYILTNAHVIARATKIHVTLIDNRTFEATLVGADPKTDIAVIKIEAEEPLPTASMGTSEDILIGEPILAIGNPFGLSHTVTTGIVSALNRSIKGRGGRIYSDFIQLDASINPGNSGGPLVNILGEVIGINSAIYHQAEGIGFAIPIDKAKRIVDDLIAYGEVPEVWLGLKVQKLTPRIAEYFGYKGQRGVLIVKLNPKGPASVAGVRREDIIVAVGGTEPSDRGEYETLVSAFTVGDTVPHKIFREGKMREVGVVAAEVPEHLAFELAKERLGLEVEGISKGLQKSYRLATSKGVVVVGVVPRSPAQRIGIEPGDVVRQVNRFSVGGIEEFRDAMLKARQSETMVLLVQRGRNGYYVTIEQ
jgi:serine protease Do